MMKPAEAAKSMAGGCIFVVLVTSVAANAADYKLTGDAMAAIMVVTASVLSAWFASDNGRE